MNYFPDHNLDPTAELQPHDLIEEIVQIYEFKIISPSDSHTVSSVNLFFN
jgi:hypothetical protein